MEYSQFLKSKSQLGNNYGFEPIWLPEFLFDFQKVLVDWALLKGRGAIFADCGMGKTPMQLVWAENIIRKTNKPVLILTPLAVAHQTMREGEKFDIDCFHSKDGTIQKKIVITNYEKLHYFNWSDFSGIVCDESSILKNFDGKRKSEITEFCRMIPYRLLCTATAAPNDYIELGTSAEALGVMGHMDMLTKFFRNVDGGILGRANSFRFKHSERLEAATGKKSFWRFKKHAEQHFWRWVCSWARAVRKPSDLGFEDGEFILPPLIERETIVEYSRPINEGFFVLPAIGLKAQRQERRETLSKRCEAVAEKINGNNVALVWCHLNDEGDLLEKIISGARQVSGSMDDEEKEEIFTAFSDGELKTLITKPRIGGFGLNWQHCDHMTFFPSHSYEQYYQGVRRCWRFGQKNPVTVDIITTKGELKVLKNLQRKSIAADKMFSQLVRHMNNEIDIESSLNFAKEERTPSWL